MPKLTVIERPTPAAITVLANDFLADRRGAGLSVRSVGHYSNCLHQIFLPWCAEAGVTDPAQLTPQLVTRFQTHLLEDGGKRGQLSRASVRSYIQAVRVFLGWAGRSPEHEDGGGGAVVGASPKLPKRTKPMIDVLSKGEIDAMEDAAARRNARDALLIRLLADTGLRLSEALGLRVEDIWQQRPGEYFLKVTGKGSKDRQVPLTPKLRQRLVSYLKGRHAEGSDRIFLSLRRKGADGDYAPLTVSGAEQVVHWAAVEAGITKRVYPHLLRHSFATAWVRSGKNLISLRNVLGHFDLSMIQGTYSHLNTSDDYDAMMSVLLGKE